MLKRTVDAGHSLVRALDERRTSFRRAGMHEEADRAEERLAPAALRALESVVACSPEEALKMDNEAWDIRLESHRMLAERGLTARFKPDGTLSVFDGNGAEIP